MTFLRGEVFYKVDVRLLPGDKQPRRCRSSRSDSNVTKYNTTAALFLRHLTINSLFACCTCFSNINSLFRFHSKCAFIIFVELRTMLFAIVTVLIFATSIVSIPVVPDVLQHVFGSNEVSSRYAPCSLHTLLDRLNMSLPMMRDYRVSYCASSTGHNRLLPTQCNAVNTSSFSSCMNLLLPCLVPSTHLVGYTLMPLLMRFEAGPSVEDGSMANSSCE